MNLKTHYNAIIIGGGASGMMAAGQIIEHNPDATVLLIEKNKHLGEKLSITGGGRCNITNATFDLKEMLPRYGAAEKFLYSAFDQFGVQDTIDFFEKRNLPIVVQAYNRAFPKSENANDVTRVMTQFCTHPNITIFKNTSVVKINQTNSQIDFIETQKGERYTANSYILATGGLSHPETGSTGDGFKWLTDLGHIVKQPTPTLVPWTVSDSWIHTHAGTSLDDVKITISVDSKKYFSCVGRILCTHTGLSGPTILNNSSKLQDALLSGAVTGSLDLYPHLNHKEIDQLILDTFEKNKNKKFKNVIDEITRLHSGFLILQKHLPLDFDIPVHSVSKEYRKSLTQLLKQIPLYIRGLEGYTKSVVADGGITLTEVDTKTMRSKKISNLFITGDLLDIRRPSGGYSLQLCWTTGFVAGVHCLKK
jgi:predicted Rossmann fold flavoprotein